MVNGTRDNFKTLGDEDVFKEAKLSADAGFHNEANMKMLAESEIDAYVADNQFRKRYPRFADYGRYKERHRKELAQRQKPQRLFTPGDFTFPEDLSYCICPAGKRLCRSGGNVKVRNHLATKFKGQKSSCLPCELRKQCLRHPERTEIRQVAFFHGKSADGKNTFTAKMKRKIDSAAGKVLYSMYASGGCRATFCQHLLCDWLEEILSERQEKGKYSMESFLHCSQPEKDPPIWTGSHIEVSETLNMVN